jgi:hypothetical protein
MKIGAALVAAHSLFAYDEWSVPNLTAPTVINAPAIEVQFQHQFLGRIDGKDAVGRFFGIGDGADGHLALHAVIWSAAQVSVSYDNLQVFSHSRNEFAADAAYAVPAPLLRLRTQIDVQYFSYASSLTFPEKRHNNFFAQLSLQNDPLFDRVVMIANGGYDFDKNRYGLGIGLDVKVFDAFDVFGTCFPRVDGWHDTVLGAPAGTKPEVPFSAGVKITTAGHQFFLTLGNASEIGQRHLMQGTLDNTLKLGFLIKRLFSF